MSDERPSGEDDVDASEPTGDDLDDAFGSLSDESAEEALEGGDPSGNEDEGTVEPPAAELGEDTPVERSPFEELEGETDREGLDTLFEEAFTDESVEEADVNTLWEELESFETASPGEGQSEVVPKRSFCEQCQYLSEPPEFRCTHEGTEIVDFVDTDHVRVRECPIVAQRRGVGPE